MSERGRRLREGRGRDGCAVEVDESEGETGTGIVEDMDTDLGTGHDGRCCAGLDMCADRAIIRGLWCVG